MTLVGELFELELYGEGIERRYRKMRPEVEEMPWGSVDVAAIPEELCIAARKAWTSAAFQEYRTGIACAMTLRSLMEAGAPLDLMAMATRFPLDELVHVELCARMAMELGGGTELRHDPRNLCRAADPDLPPLLAAADMVVRFFCVGEALSIPLLRATARHADHPLAKKVLSRIVRDEAAHGTFGFAFLDWAEDRLSEDDRNHLGRAADATIAGVKRRWETIKNRPPAPVAPEHPLAWMESTAYFALAEKSLQKLVIAPLVERNIPIGQTNPEPEVVAGFLD